MRKGKGTGGWLACAAAIASLVHAAPDRAHAAVAHVVQPGETLWSIAAANNLTTRTVAAFNGVPEDANVVLGQTIHVPTVEEGAAALAAAGIAPGSDAGTSPGGGAAHVVQPGESLSSVAAAHGISAESLAAANGRAADSFLYAGETITIPAAGTAPSAGPPQPAPGSTYGLGHIPSPSGELHLDPAAADAWNAMREASLEQFGVDLYPAGPLSAYRTYEQQAHLYEHYLAGEAPLAAVPGTSAHETGTAVDLAEPVMRDVIDQIGASYGWGKTEAPDEWWHVNFLGW